MTDRSVTQPGRWRRRAVAALSLRPFRVALVAGTTLALVRPGDAQLFLAFQRDAALDLSRFPLLFAAASVVFLVAAAPMGVLADRIGLLRVFVIGEVAVAGALAVLASGASGPGALALLLAMTGISYAATDGVLMALASVALPERWRTTGLAVMATAIAGGRFVASVAYGAIWERAGAVAVARVFLVGAAGAVVVGVMLVRREDRVPDPEEARS